MFTKAMIVMDIWTTGFPLSKCARGLKKLGTSDLCLLECIEEMNFPGINLDIIRSSAQSELEKQKSFLIKYGMKVEAKALVGKTCRSINRVAVEEDRSLIVLGSYMHTRTYEILMGNTASEAICNQIMPILLIHMFHGRKQPDYINEESYEFLEHVLFPTDFSTNADYALKYLEKILDMGPGRITLMHVQNRTLISPHLSHKLEEFNRIDYERLSKIKEQLVSRTSHSTPIEIIISYGHPVKEITETINSKNVSLIVMGSQGRGFMQETFIGSISQNVARSSRAPILLIPMPERDRNRLQFQESMQKTTL